MGRIPGFSAAIFPAAANPNLTLVANLGLILFLFLVGLEVDLRFLASNWRISIPVSLAAMALPFGLGCGIAYGLYHQFRDDPGTVPIKFGTFMLFIGVAMAITAFPVLCRILTELKLLQTPVGIIVLSAGVGNDVVGWILLALCVALVNAGSGITALWVLLVCVGYGLFLFLLIRPCFLWFLNRTHSIQNGPSQSVVALTLFIALTSAFFTGIIGVHPIFGAFMAGLICPHEGGFAIKVTEKVEDLVTTLFLPLYFALSGLSTNLGLLNTGITWAYVVGVITVAFSGKFIAATLAARLSGLVWRESFTVGSLMSCKGLVELIVLNIGLQAQILSRRTFTIFVVMALVTTFATTPLTEWLYPPWYQKKLEAWKRGEIDWDTGKPTGAVSADTASTRDSLSYEKLEGSKVKKMLVYVRLDSMPTILAFMSILGGSPKETTRAHPSKQAAPSAPAPSLENDRQVRPIEAHGVRLLELTERESSVMQVSELEEYSLTDPLVNTFRAVGNLHNLAVSGEVAVLPESSFSDVLTTKATSMSSDFMLIPWTETGSMSETAVISAETSRSKLSAPSYASFVLNALDETSCTTAIFVNRNFGGTTYPSRPMLQRTKSALSIQSFREGVGQPTAPVADHSHHIFCAFIGGADDRAALGLVLQLAENPDVTATIAMLDVNEKYFVAAAPIKDDVITTAGSSRPFELPRRKTGEPATSETELAAPSARDAAFFASVRNSLPADIAARVLFESVSAGMEPLKVALERAAAEVGKQRRNAGDLIVLGRNVARLAVFGSEVGVVDDTTRCLGAIGAEAARKGLQASVVIVQASENYGLKL